MRALVVTNMWPSPEAPARGAFVRDQVAALRALPGVEVEVFAFPPGGYARAALALRRRHRGEDFDVVHAHFGLTAWPALALRGAPHAVTLHGTDVRHPRSGRITRAALPFVDLVADGQRPAGAGARRPSAPPALPRAARGAPVRRRHDPLRAARRARRHASAWASTRPSPVSCSPPIPPGPVKRADRAREAAGEARLLTLGQVEPADVPLWINAANAVLVPSDAEGFGLAVLEALACDVPVLATPVGAHPAALGGHRGNAVRPLRPRHVARRARAPPGERRSARRGPCAGGLLVGRAHGPAGGRGLV